MARLPSPKRLRSEDFDAEQKSLIERLGFIINDFNESVFQAFNNAITFSNMNQQMINVTLKVTSTGIPQLQTQFKYLLSSGRLEGVICIKATNNDTASNIPTGTPWVTFNYSGGIGEILNVTGLEPDDEYTLKLLLIGSD